jgi:hypothetical protein
MARITKKQKTDPRKIDEAVGLYGMGKSSREVEKETGINFMTVTREAKRRGVCKGQLENLCDKLSQIDEEKAEIETKLLQLPVNVAKMVTDTAEARRLQTEFFNNAALVTVREAMTLDANDQYANNARAKTIQLCRDSVLGKAPDVAVQVNNNITLEDLLKDVKI